ncbi:Holliday junction resolvase RuvX [Pseudokineococcus lusitanus]|uniref:Putative pre-16S rRNA nuclease n=1 Tax=Pseudokineococcus lusitanus TaxID=763993 RepID=A0A3N1G9B9_9ACTN|nr:Holliday junction resolvase RuvX [Pseudokineococcus lusitanus]ROP26839.1 putative transcription antitermination factor YqgF [Pseudokineococcus lusitanus]
MARSGQPRPKRKRGAEPAVGPVDVADAVTADEPAAVDEPFPAAPDTVPTVRPGVRLGVDVGSVRVGLAASDPGAVLASAVETVPRERPAAGPRPRTAAARAAARAAAQERGEPSDLRRIAAVAAERGAVEVVVGLPRSMSGAENRAAGLARQYAARLADLVAPVPVRLVDERLSTSGAQRALHEGGTPGRRHRAVVDQVAAAWVLQAALDLERSTGRPPGSPVTPLSRQHGSGRPTPGAAAQDPQHDEHHPHDQEDDDEVAGRRGARPDREQGAGPDGPAPQEGTTVTSTARETAGPEGPARPRPVPGPPPGRRPAVTAGDEGSTP